MELGWPWDVIVANLVLFVVAMVVVRWARNMLLGLFGLAIIILPAMSWYLAGRISTWDILFLLGGVLLLAADLRDRLPDREFLRKKLLRRDRSAP